MKIRLIIERDGEVLETVPCDGFIAVTNHEDDGNCGTHLTGRVDWVNMTHSFLKVVDKQAEGALPLALLALLDNEESDEVTP